MKSKLPGFFGVVACVFSGVLFAASPGASEATAGSTGLQVTDAWVRLVPPVAGNSAAYMLIKNTGSQDQVVVSAASPVAEAVEVHQTSMKDGVMAMSEVKGLRIPSQGKVMMKPGGYHVMLINLNSPLKAGQLVPVSLGFKSGAVLEIEAPVRAMPTGHKMKHKHS
ncbi:MAG: copper chaperone PCu(A)C [Pontibacterium sp.]